MDFKEIVTNQVVIGAGGLFATAVLGMILTRKKLYAWGLALSKILNARIGAKSTQWLEDKLQEFLDGMKQDNNKK